jgi:hypothetical protein
LDEPISPHPEDGVLVAEIAYRAPLPLVGRRLARANGLLIWIVIGRPGFAEVPDAELILRIQVE